MKPEYARNLMRMQFFKYAYYYNMSKIYEDLYLKSSKNINVKNTAINMAIANLIITNIDNPTNDVNNVKYITESIVMIKYIIIILFNILASK